tara:strand:- start:270 stop:1073 length:804 start_codon:yes stop_codon:yes gene_type:complete
MSFQRVRTGKSYVNKDDLPEFKNDSFYNIGIICDNSWDNYLIMNKYLKKIDPDYYKIHTLYFKNLSIIQKSNNNCNITLLRHGGDNLIKITYNLFKIVDFWIIFTNQIEYLSPVALIYEKCQSLNINYILINENNNLTFNLNKNENIENFNQIKIQSFKKFLKFIIINEIKFNNLIPDYDEFITDINEDYNKLFLEKYLPELKLTSDIVSKLKNRYNRIENSKHQIAILYDKQEAKKEKEAKKLNKQTSYLNFTENRQKFINSFKNQ